MFSPCMMMGGGAAGGGGGVIFPNVVNSNAHRFESQLTSGAFGLPSSLVTGNYLVLFLCAATSVELGGALATNWVQLSQAPVPTGNFWAFKRLIDGTEGSSVGVTFSSSVRACAISYQIENAHGDMEADVSALSENPPALTPSWGAGKILWLAATGHRRTLATPSVIAAPSTPAAFGSFVRIQNGTASTSNQYCGIAASALQYEAGTVDPGPFTYDPSAPATERRAFTVAVRGT